MAQPPARHVWRIVLTNFLNSLRPRQIRGTFMGEDYFGNKYYEIGANPSIGKRRASRWFEPSDKDAFDQELPAEWEAWLRNRRDNVPTDEELMKNLAIMDMKKTNALKLDQKFKKVIDKGDLQKIEKGLSSFPKYDDYELIPGKENKK